jgi:hypothetical protein
MGNLGDSFLPAFWQGIGIMLGGLWQGMLENPWLFALLAFIIVGGLYLQLAPRRRRRRPR